jgi:hypothetical protein
VDKRGTTARISSGKHDKAARCDHRIKSTELKVNIYNKGIIY